MSFNYEDAINASMLSVGHIHQQVMTPLELMSIASQSHKKERSISNKSSMQLGSVNMNQQYLQHVSDAEDHSVTHSHGARAEINKQDYTGVGNIYMKREDTEPDAELAKYINRSPEENVSFSCEDVNACQVPKKLPVNAVSHVSKNSPKFPFGGFL